MNRSDATTCRTREELDHHRTTAGTSPRNPLSDPSISAPLAAADGRAVLVIHRYAACGFYCARQNALKVDELLDDLFSEIEPANADDDDANQPPDAGGRDAAPAPRSCSSRRWPLWNGTVTGRRGDDIAGQTVRPRWC